MAATGASRDDDLRNPPHGVRNLAWSVHERWAGNDRTTPRDGPLSGGRGEVGWGSRGATPAHCRNADAINHGTIVGWFLGERGRGRQPPGRLSLENLQCALLYPGGIRRVP